MGENKDKKIHGTNAKESLKLMLKMMKKHGFVSEVKANYAIGDEDYEKDDQFKAPFLITFSDGEQWLIFSTTAVRERMGVSEWNTLNIKRLNNAVEKAFVVIPDGAKTSELKKAFQYDEEIKEHKRYSVLDGFVTLEIMGKLIRNKGLSLMGHGSGWAKKGNEFEEKIVKVLNHKQNLEKWTHESKLTDGYFYPLFLTIVEKLQLDSSEVEEITATTNVPALGTGGKAKTDVIVRVRTTTGNQCFTISCKSTEKKTVSVHEYKPERYACVLNPADEELLELLLAFQDAGGIKRFTETERLTEKMKLYGDALAMWGVGGIGDPNVTEPEVQCAQYIISYDETGEKYHMHGLVEYIELCKQDADNGGHYGTIFRWTKKNENIQLKMKLV